MSVLNWPFFQQIQILGHQIQSTYLMILLMQRLFLLLIENQIRYLSVCHIHIPSYRLIYNVCLLILRAQNSPSLRAFSFNIKDYIEEGEVSSSAIQTHQEASLADTVKDWLQEMLPYLEQNIADLVQNAEPIWRAFLAIKNELDQDLFDALSPVAYIEGHESKVIGAQRWFADREAQKNLDEEREASKREMESLKQVINNLSKAPLKIEEELDQLKTERDQLQKRLEEVDAAIKLKENNLARLPKVISDKKKKMAIKYQEAKAIHEKKSKAIPGSVEEDEQQTAEVDAIRLKALEVVRSTLNL